MAVAAYASVMSLIHVLDQTQQYPPRHRLHLYRNQIETLREKVSFLQNFLEVHSQIFYGDLEELARQIAAVADEAEDVIDAHVVDQLVSQRSADEAEVVTDTHARDQLMSQRSADESDIDMSFFWKLVVADEAEEEIIDSHVVDQLHKGSTDKSDMDISFSCEGIDNVIEKIDSMKKELVIIEGEMNVQEPGPRDSNCVQSPALAMSGNNTTIGFDEQVDRIILELTGDKRDLQVLPIVGMGGIGKTTLAKTVFDDQYMVQHFDMRTWVSISQDYSMKRILSGLLKSGEKIESQKYEESDQNLAELGEQLHKKLYDRRYLVVMDDVWGTEVWDDLRMFFPDNSNGSRILVTTRLSNVAVSFSSRNPYVMNFLDDDKSWDLFCEKAFAKDGCCPPELEEVGKSIAKSCKGLPLAIVVTGGLLSKSNMTREYWEFVAKDVNSFANSGDEEDCSKILSLSYNHLPIHLKPCFLYMREFPEDDEIKVSKLIRLWVAEGFLKPVKEKTLEEVAREHLEDLIGRNLILRCEFRNNGEMKTLRIHDLLRDLCIRESRREHFIRAPKKLVFNLYRHRYTDCFLCRSSIASTRIDLPRVTVSSQPTPLASCLVCDDCRNKYPQLNRLRLVNTVGANLRVPSDEDILQPTKVRIFYIMGRCWFVGNLNLLWNLQTLIILAPRVVLLPPEIWELPQLRHIVTKSESIILPDPQVDRKDSIIILKNLQTLSVIKNFRWSEDAIERIPNMKKLEIFYKKRDQRWPYYSLHNLARLHKLESLGLYADPLITSKNIAFPYSLKKLSLYNSNIPWKDMSIIGSLPNLEVLKLLQNAVEGPKWNPVEGEFLRLKKLLIRGNVLVHWTAEKIHFPNLEHLELSYMRCLEEIPSGIGEIETLLSIRIRHCLESTIDSAKKMVEEQHSFGNEELQLYVDGHLVLPGSESSD